MSNIWHLGPKWPTKRSIFGLLTGLQNVANIFCTVFFSSTKVYFASHWEQIVSLRLVVWDVNFITARWPPAHLYRLVTDHNTSAKVRWLNHRPCQHVSLIYSWSVSGWLFCFSNCFRFYYSSDQIGLYVADKLEWVFWQVFLLEAAGLKQTVGQRATSIYMWTTRIKIWSEMELINITFIAFFKKKKVYY